MISNGTIIRLFTINYGIIVFRASPEFGILVTIPWIKLFLPRCYFLVYHMLYLLSVQEVKQVLVFEYNPLGVDNTINIITRSCFAGQKIYKKFCEPRPPKSPLLGVT